MKIENKDYEMSIKRHNKCLKSLQDALLIMKETYKSRLVTNNDFDVDMFVSYVPVMQCPLQSELISVNDLYSNLLNIYNDKNNDNIEIFIRFVTNKVSNKYFFCEAFKYESDKNVSITKFKKNTNGNYYTDFCFKYGYNNIDNVLNTLLKTIQSKLMVMIIN